MTTNKEQAKKVLLSVCRRYYEDDKSKQLIIASFKKLFDKGFIQLVDQLTPEELAQFHSKPVQYFIRGGLCSLTQFPLPVAPHSMQVQGLLSDRMAVEEDA